MLSRIITVLQFVTVGGVWIFAAGVTSWVVRLAVVSYDLRDAVTASFTISLVALPIFWTLAGVLTYTFFGLRRGRRR